MQCDELKSAHRSLQAGPINSLDPILDMDRLKERSKTPKNQKLKIFYPKTASSGKRGLMLYVYKYLWRYLSQIWLLPTVAD